MPKEFFDPLLKQYFGNPKLDSFEDKDRIKDAFHEATKIADKHLNQSKHKEESNTKDYNRLIDNLNLKKVLVGSASRKPFYALVDFKERVCLPLIEDAKVNEVKE